MTVSRVSSAPRDIVVVGASDGGFDALRRMLPALPQDLRASIFVVTHYPPAHNLPATIRYNSALPLRYASDLDPIEHGIVSFCPNDRFMLLENGIIRIEDAPRDFIYRSSVDRLFRSAAQVYGRRVIGVVLSGRLRDGTAGLFEIKKHGGIAIVQEPSDSKCSAMPESAMANVDVDCILPAEEIAAAIVEFSERSKAKQQAGVLIVEDEQLVAENLRDHLGTFGYRVAGCVTTGTGAIEAAGQNDVDLVLMDIRLPGEISGVDAARVIWQRYQIPVVYITAYADEQTLAAVKTTENYGYVAKPFPSKAIKAAVELAIARREKELR